MDILIILIALAAAAIVLCTLILMILFAWHHLSTRGVAYFGRPQAEREQFKREVANCGQFVNFVLRPLSRKPSEPNRFAMEYAGVYAPAGSCNRRTFQRAVHYAPQANDLFIVTQMKCGTTWMQQIAYEVLSRGAGDLSDQGHRHLYAVSPWLESFNSVSVQDAPLIGPSRTRIIKTHLPAALCPYDPAARYIYVTRHPVSCFGSTVDFMRALSGPFMPAEDAMVEWFCSDRMWWGSWPEHVAGFWEWAEARPNVLYCHFEEMKADLPGVIRRVADFLACDLTEGELACVAEKSSFRYMQAHEAQFEMNPPNFFSAGYTFFKSGAARDHAALDPAHRDRILAYCGETLQDRTYPAARFYPDIQSGGG